MGNLFNVLFILFLLSPLVVAIILMVKVKNTDTMFYTKFVGLTFGVFNIGFLIMTLTDSGNGGGLFIGLGFFFFVLPINAIAFMICFVSDLNMMDESSKNVNEQ